MLPEICIFTTEVNNSLINYLQIESINWTAVKPSSTKKYCYG